ncbi:MAG: hypothetical protein AAB131_23600, partial [Actinomycetota bacterium]
MTTDLTTGTNEHLVLSPSGTGKVGIGITTPISLLQVEGDTFVTGKLDSPHGGFGPYQNLLVQSEVFEHAAWAETGYTISAGTLSAPDGGATAELLGAGVAITDNTLQTISGQVTASKTYTGSVWLQMPSGTGTIGLRLKSGNEIGTTTNASVTTTWQRFSVTQTFTSGSTVNLIFEIINGTTGVRAWGAQVEDAASAGVYARTTTEQVAGTTRDRGLAIGQNTHVTGNLEVHGNIITHGTGGGADQTISGNLTVNGTTTLGDTAVDSVTVNAGPMTLVNAIVAGDALEFGSGANLANLYRSANDTLKTDDAFLVAGTMGVT